MSKIYAFGSRPGSRRWVAAAALALGLVSVAQAQTTPDWSAALTSSQPYSGNATATASVADASGNVYVTGFFTGQIQVGSTTLVSVGNSDIFVAKWNAAAGTWAWVIRAGGTDFDQATALALNGTSLYLTGFTTDNAAGGNAVTFGTLPLVGKASTASNDLFVAKLTDAGSTASFVWALNGGGSRADAGASLAVSGGSVYVGGAFTNDVNNSQAVTFGTLPLNGLSPTSTFNSDAVVAKIADAGSTASFTWALAAGGGAPDQVSALAVSGGSVYAAGYLTNTSSNTNGVTFGAVGTVNGQATASTQDAFITKITDGGASGAFTWVQVAGGSDADRATALAVSGSNVYAAGYFTNTSGNANGVTFGAAGALNGQATAASQDAFVTKLTDGGSTGAFTWAQAAGGFGSDQANALVANGTALYVGGVFTNDSFNNNVVSFGSLGALNGTTTTNSQDGYVARLTDAGSSATWGWAQAGGGPGLDNVTGLALRGSSLYPVGTFTVQAGFGSAVGSPLVAGATSCYVGQLTEASGGTSASWARVAQAQVGGAFIGQATAADASGNVYVAGSFSGRIVLGATTLTAAGALDAFVAKWSPTTNTWVWALGAGGLAGDQVNGLAVSGGSVYATGFITESNANANLTRFGTLTATGQATSTTQDIFVAKIADAGASASWSWVQVAGGAGIDVARAITASGSSVYLAGYFSNNTANTNAVTFGAATLAGLGTSASGNDAFVAKLTDGGSTGTFGWALAGGGLGTDQASGVAVSGGNVFATGYFSNNAANVNTVAFGSTTLAGQGTSSFNNDIFVTKIADAGSSATYTWALAAGGAGSDQPAALAVSGSSVYAAGYVNNNAANANAVAFGSTTLAGASTTSSTSNDAFVAKITDAGSAAAWTWAQMGGGSSTDQATGLAVSGVGVYATGYYLNTTANANATTFGPASLLGFGTTATPDIFLVKYTDAGSSASLAWAQRAGSAFADQAFGLVANGARLYATGFAQGAAAFSSTVLTNPYNAQVGFVAQLNDVTSPLAAAAGQRQEVFTLYPNPARGAATVVGLAPGAALQVADLLGRAVATATADATGQATLALPASLSPGVYLVRSGTLAQRLTVE